MGEFKFCTRCEEDKPIGEFNRNRTASDGLQWSCKVCQVARNREYRERNRDAVNAKKRAAAAADSARGMPRHLVKKWEEKNGDKVAAHKAVYRATRSGRLVRPETCEQCGELCRPQAHHEDYSRWLDVVWLCTPCHGRIHAGVIALSPHLVERAVARAAGDGSNRARGKA